MADVGKREKTGRVSRERDYRLSIKKGEGEINKRDEMQTM